MFRTGRVLSDLAAFRNQLNLDVDRYNLECAGVETLEENQ
jgi:hypothetical protein